MIKYLRNLIYGKYIQEIKCLRYDVFVRDRKIDELMDLKNELKVFVNGTAAGFYGVTVYATPPEVKTLSSLDMTFPDQLSTVEVVMERAFGTILIEDIAYKEEATYRLKQMVAQYIGNEVAKQLEE